MYFKEKKIMIVVAHPDDELLGLGATMHKLIAEENVLTHVLILGEGITSRFSQKDHERSTNELKVHQENVRDAQKVIGYHSVKTFNFPDNRFDTVPLLDIVKIVESEKDSFRPDIIFTHHGGDLNVDHQKTFEAVMTSCRPLENEKVNTIITFETPSSTEWQAPLYKYQFCPNLFVEVQKDDIDAKINAMECYKYEKRTYPHPRSPQALEILARQWGVKVGSEYIEAFTLIRHVLKNS
jgi:LmbE family N-acetylglucosaminyl deacetylase